MQNGDHMINNLSRIRISPQNSHRFGDNKALDGGNGSVDYNIYKQLTADQNTITSGDELIQSLSIGVSKSWKWFQESVKGSHDSAIDSDSVTISSLSGADNRCPPVAPLIPLTPGAHPSLPINYMHIELNAECRRNASSPHLPYRTLTIAVRNVWVIAVEYECGERRAIELLVDCLKDCPLQRQWMDQMRRYGFIYTTIDNLRNLWANSLDHYIRTCPDVETAATVNPLFNTMHRNFIPKTDKTTELQRLRQEFEMRCVSQQNNPQTIECTDSVKVLTDLETALKCMFNNINVKIGDNTLTDLSMPINILGIKLNDNFDTNLCSHYLPYKTYALKINTKLSYVAIKYRCEVEPAVHKLLDLLNRHRFYMKVNGIDGWDLIAQHMIANEFSDWYREKCWNCFIQALTMYKKTLKNCSNKEVANLHHNN
ncbi:unnamed protein product [Medioppia subpectinata]|uniref:Uncharacterized protein n=1 Tax=Medioppia subpectinata TaxID=1979941 RepID=A0A7R9L099_9ACAR|nr:unnamed protein product [Medioppia subpectinata]CAG2111941.1 unnamed protein product [Medioppia subpectinata]